MERCQEHRPCRARFRGILGRKVFVSTRKVQKMRQIMTTRDRKCSKQGSIAGMCARCIQVENVFKRGNFGYTLRPICQCPDRKSVWKSPKSAENETNNGCTGWKVFKTERLCDVMYWEYFSEKCLKAPEKCRMWDSSQPRSGRKCSKRSAFCWIYLLMW